MYHIPQLQGWGQFPKSNPFIIIKTINSLMYVKVRFLFPNGLWKLFFKGFWILQFQRRDSGLIIAYLYYIIAV